MAFVVYSSHYAMGFPGLGLLHPFDLNRASRAYKLLQQKCGYKLRHLTLFPRGPANESLLRLVHPQSYLEAARTSKVIAAIVETPLLGWFPSFLCRSLLTTPMLWAVSGTVMAVEAALQRKTTVFNLAGGFHHAKPEAGEGFCVYADVAIAIAHARARNLVREDAEIWYIDTDAHLGNGLGHCFLEDKRFKILDIFNASTYPLVPSHLRDSTAIDRVDYAVPLSPGTTDERYLDRLSGALEMLKSENKPPALVVYNAGTDPYLRDRIGGLQLTDKGIFERDRRVLDLCRTMSVPTVVVPSGGYSKESFRLVADTVAHYLA